MSHERIQSDKYHVEMSGEKIYHHIIERAFARNVRKGVVMGTTDDMENVEKTVNTENIETVENTEAVENTETVEKPQAVETVQADPVIPQEPDNTIPPEKHTKKVNLIDSLKTLGRRIIDVFKDYPVTMISIVVAALLGSILIEWDNHDTEIYMERAIAFFLILAMQTLLFEEVFPLKKVIRYTGYAVSAALSAAYVYVLSNEAEVMFGMDHEILNSWLVKILVVHGVAFAGVSIHHMFDRLEEDFEVYAARAFLELVKSTVVYGLFALGLAAIIWIFNELIFDTDDFLSQVELFLAAGIYTPMCLKAISSKNEEPGKFARVCFLYVLQPMLIVAFGIIYLYIIKIFATNDIPSNRIFNILAFLFAIGMPVWTVVHGMEQKKSFLQRIIVYLPYVFIPFVLLQSWSIGLRISEYGITTARYQAIVLVFCEVVYFALYFWHRRGRKRAIADILYVLIAVSFFGILCPVTNWEDTVIRSQIKRLVVMIDSKDADPQDIKSSFRALNYAGYRGKDALQEKLTPEQIAKIEDMNEYQNIIKDEVYLYGSKMFTDVDITGYSSLCEVEDNHLADDGTMTLSIRHDGYNSENIDVDLSEYLNYIMDNYHESYSSDFRLSDNYIVNIDANTTLYLTYLSMSYDRNTRHVESLSLSGYLLRK